jgi:hypothetical protein
MGVPEFSPSKGQGFKFFFCRVICLEKSLYVIRHGEARGFGPFERRTPKPSDSDLDSRSLGSPAELSSRF